MSVQANPFKRTTIIIMVVIGFFAFVGLLYGLGAGNRLTSANDGQAHGASYGFAGYKALAEIIEKTGTKVQYSRSAAGNDNAGLLILTPAAYANAEDLAEVVHNRSYIGPTLIILPKWYIGSLPGLKQGWAAKGGTIEPDTNTALLADLVDAEIKIDEKRKKLATLPSLSAVAAQVKAPEVPVTIKGDYLRTITRDRVSGRALAAYIDDGGVYAQLDSLDESRITDEDEIDASYFPVVVVADADLMNNAGMADKQTARHAIALIEAASTGSEETVTFDLTFNGLGTSENLLTLAFEPPFLSATICLIVAAMAAAWMAFNRFGPPLRERRSIDYGKTALVNNSAGFIGRMQREYLVAEPYAEMIRAQAAEAIGLSSVADDALVNEKLDQLGEVDGNRFSALYQALRRTQNRNEVADAAAALFNWKKEKIG